MKMIVYGLVAVATATAAPPIADYIARTSDDPVASVLRRYGFTPVNPPSTLMSVGSLYYVDSSVRDFTAICHPKKADLENVVLVGRTWEIQENLERNGQLTTGVSIDLGWLLRGDVDKNYVVKVKSSLADLVLEEIPLGPNWLIFANLMKDPQCSEVAMRYLNAGGYVCQGQRTLRGTAEFKLDNDTKDRLASNASATPKDIKDIVRLAVETQGKQSVVAKEGRLLAGRDLTYGATMAPLCLAPKNAHFDRILPQSSLDRLKNFVMFKIIEPMLPAKSGGSEVAHASNHAPSGVRSNVIRD